MSARWPHFCCRFTVDGAGRHGSFSAITSINVIAAASNVKRRREFLTTIHLVLTLLTTRVRRRAGGEWRKDRATPIPDTDTTRPGRTTGTTATMSTKRKIASGKAKNRPKSRKVEYDEEDISSEHDSEIDDAEAGSNADGEDAAAEDALADVSNMPELPAPEVN